LFLLGAGYQGVRATRRPTAAGSAPPLQRGPLRISALASTGLILVVALGAANYGGVHATPHTSARKTATTHLNRGRTRAKMTLTAHPNRDPLAASTPG
jgi:hypothetical protein